jgi:hypothetical protein
MLMYVLIGLCLVLVGVAGLQFTYLAYADRMNGERRKYLKALEHKYIELARRLADAEQKLVEQQHLLDAAYPDLSEEGWAEVIEDR